MKYSPECVAEFEAKFPPPNHIEFLRSGSIGGYVLKKGAKIDVDDKPLLDVFLQDRMLAAFAANWERVRELEEMLEQAASTIEWLGAADSDGGINCCPNHNGHGFYGDCVPCYVASSASKLLEKGNE